MKYLDGKYVVIQSREPNVSKGESISLVNGYTTTQLEYSLRKYVSVGSDEILRREACRYMINGNLRSHVVLEIKDLQGNTRTDSFLCMYNVYSNFFEEDYINDTLSQVLWKRINCDIGYVHMGNIMPADVPDMYSDLKTCSSIIYDIRNYPQGAAFTIADWMYDGPKEFVINMDVNTEYPGTFFPFVSRLGMSSNPNPYYGQVIILFDERTQSHAEYSCMILEALPNVIKVGSQTAGADGNIVRFSLNNSTTMGYTGLGVYYPDFTPTQRVGIVPDTLVRPTQQGIIDGRDEVLEAALSIAGCDITDVSRVPSYNLEVQLYPNPNSGKFQLVSNNKDLLLYQIYDVLGRPITQGSFRAAADISLPTYELGVYTLVITTSDAQQRISFTVR